MCDSLYHLIHTLSLSLPPSLPPSRHRVLGCGLIWLRRRHSATVGEITDRPEGMPFSHKLSPSASRGASAVGQGASHGATRAGSKTRAQGVAEVHYYPNHSSTAQSGSLGRAVAETNTSSDLSNSPSVSIQISIETHTE